MVKRPLLPIPKVLLMPVQKSPELQIAALLLPTHIVVLQLSIGLLIRINKNLGSYKKVLTKSSGGIIKAFVWSCNKPQVRFLQ